MTPASGRILMRETSVDSQRLLGKAMPGFARVIVEVDFHGLPLRPQPSRSRGLLQAVSLALRGQTFRIEAGLFGAAIFGIHAAQKNSAMMRFRVLPSLEFLGDGVRGVNEEKIGYS
ncbi:hypothetical protein [Pandoraea pnomenusa]|uniref:hypothetical protein n=1 Tax=Pandoraea pnomenusa TaxID=93220 RepID=UPI001E28E37E|nr:hypothetical protein [Pandoraea pnomenusa]